MEADDRQITTVFTVQPSFHHRHSTNRVSGSVTFQQKFAFGGRSMKFGVEILLTMLYLNIDKSKTF